MRYVLNMHRTRPDWPTRLDTLWEVHQHAARKNKSAEFVDSELDALFGEDAGKARQYLDQFYADGLFRKSRISKDGTQHYKIDKEKNPFL